MLSSSVPLSVRDECQNVVRRNRFSSLEAAVFAAAYKAFARRLPEPILPELIHHNQNGFIKGRSTFDAVRKIDDLIYELAKITNKTGILN